MPYRRRLDLQAVADLARVADYTVPFTLRAVATLKVADELVESPLPIEELAARVGAHAPFLKRALSLLARHGLFSEQGDRFGLTRTSSLLVRDHPLSMRDTYPVFPAAVRAWESLAVGLRKGVSAFTAAHGHTMWTHFENVPEDGRTFDRGQEAQSRLECATVLRSIDWPAAGLVVDIGGGSGSFLTTVLRRNPGLEGVLFDLPPVTDRAEDLLDRARVAHRCRVVGGSFLEDVPPNGDVYLLKRILYGWESEQAVTILRNVRAAMKPNARVLIMEPIRGESELSAQYDVILMVMLGTGARDLEEIDALLAAAGLRRSGLRRTLLFPIVEARAST
jgi:hypothetical protein